jgi:hypothetical protein
MVVIPGPVEFLMGSPPTENGREAGQESQHKRRIGRPYALAAKAVTVREFRQFLKENKLEAWFDAGGQAAPLMKRYGPDENGPAILMDWYEAAAYCNWLSQQDGIPEDQWESVPGERECLCESPFAASSPGKGGEYEVSLFLAGSATASKGIEEELLGASWVSAANGSRNGVCVPCGSSDELVLWGDGGPPGQLRLVYTEQQVAYPAGGCQEAE